MARLTITDEPATAGGQEMRDRIREAALDLFADKSYHATTMADIARACGITKAGLYYYFRTKADLLSYVYETVNQNLAVALSHANDTSVPTEERLAAIIRAQVGHHVQYRSFLAVFWRERHELEPEVRKRVRAHERRFEKAMRDLLIEGQRSGIFRPFDVEARALMILSVLSTVYRWAHHVEMSVEKIAEEVLDFVIGGITEPSHHRP
jgi:TetR/AcrR family transcriptional regulator, cholesterol catabolism regulator